jgi:RNA-directed DNA polymerase
MAARRGDISAVCVNACPDCLSIGSWAWGLRLNNGSRMSREVHVRFCEGLAGKFRRSTLLVILCCTEEGAKKALTEVKGKIEERGLTLHPEKTRIVDATIKGGGFDFLGYHFERSTRWPRNKSMKKLKDTIRQKTIRTSGESMQCIIAGINRSLVGWFEYFRHSNRKTFQWIDGWIRMRLRSILRKRQGRHGRGRGTDHWKWPNTYFGGLGLFTLTAAHDLARQSR